MSRKPCFAYLRVSGKKQIGGHGFDRQLDTIEKYCNNSYDIIQVYREQVSGVKCETERPEFTAMVTEILTDHVGTVIVESLDRLAREYRIQESLLVYLASKGITLISANTGEDVTRAIREDPMKKALVQIQGIFAELDKNTLSARLRKGRERKRQTGWKEGPKPYGSLPGEKEVLKRISYMRRKSSRYQARPRTFKSIADRFNTEGVLTRTGKQWTASLAANLLANSRKRADRHIS